MMLRVTGVGSLPHTDPRAAADFVLATADVPYLPQLPHRHAAEGMLAQWGDGLAGCGAAPGALGLRFGAPAGDRSEAFGGAAAMLAALPPGTPLVKTQATGPVTLAMAARAGGAPEHGLLDTVVSGLVARVGEHLRWLERHLPAADVVVMLDEPALAGLPGDGFPMARSEVRRVLTDTIGALPAPAGIHCCGETEWELWALVATTGARWFSWDVAALGAGSPEAARAVARAVAGGAGVVWGVAPTGGPPLPVVDELVGRFRRVEGELIVAGAPAAALADRAWLTPACGLAGLTVDQADAVVSAVRSVAGEVRVGG